MEVETMSRLENRTVSEGIAFRLLEVVEVLKGHASRHEGIASQSAPNSARLKQARAVCRAYLTAAARVESLITGDFKAPARNLWSKEKR
jgi:hypothetical protein